MRVRNIRDLQKKEFKDISDEDEAAIKLLARDKDSLCFGGVLLTNENGSIVLNNTLDSRCEQCFDESLPEIREMLGMNQGSLKM